MFFRVAYWQSKMKTWKREFGGKNKKRQTVCRYVQYCMNGKKNGAHITIIEFEGRQTTRVREMIYKEKWSNWIVFCANIYLASCRMYDFYSFRSRVVLLLLQKNSPAIRWSKVLQGLSMAAWGICKDSLNFFFSWLLAIFYQVHVSVHYINTC